MTQSKNEENLLPENMKSEQETKDQRPDTGIESLGITQLAEKLKAEAEEAISQGERLLTESVEQAGGDLQDTAAGKVEIALVQKQIKEIAQEGVEKISPGDIELKFNPE